ncbi:tRNA (guanine-N1)-methyltransferase [Tamlana fucoidanivorans]|uniref:tRNA (Guanine-N1)-methyltransferase n=1 Tax=Allotamlana fucoidanivorans TaxID=2583814 RepID=A0A5C4SJ95_9FLAO|nr:tRNA (guanine-N1)-methyltransferase [Tamlana fucoidanivorans]TNJ43124.1 tRNA (guanine-N1)-methyltransferase [Tamlana fucoidanivorans]
MNFIKSLLVILFSFLFSMTSFSQVKSEDDNLSLNSGTIDNQFEFVIRKSNNYQNYKVVNKSWLYTLKAHTLDTLKAVHKDLNETRSVVKQQAQEISDLQSNLSNTKMDLDQTNIEKNSMALFGMQMSKTNYNVLMWSIIGALLALLLFFIYKFKNSNAITTEARRNLAEIEEEFDEHRRTALEREQKVRRQLQDEINKQKKG